VSSNSSDKNESKEISPEGIELMSLQEHSEVRNSQNFVVEDSNNKDLLDTFEYRKQMVMKKLFESNATTRNKGKGEADIDFAANKK
jgi:hypothetical protein